MLGSHALHGAFTMHAELSSIDAPHGSLHRASPSLLLLPQGKVLYQNASSLEYMGDLLSGKYDGYMDEGLLQVWGNEVWRCGVWKQGGLRGCTAQ